jgi:hypothetical protein
MRALRAFLLLTLCVGTLANWFRHEPVNRTISPIRSTNGVDEALTVKALPALKACLGEAPVSVNALTNLLRAQGHALGEKLEWRMVSFANPEGTQFRLHYRREKGDARATLRLRAMQEGGLSGPLPLLPRQLSMPPQEAFASVLSGQTVLSDVSSTTYYLEGKRRWRQLVENDSVKAVEYFAPGLHLHCSAAYGPATCTCTKEKTE